MQRQTADKPAGTMLGPSPTSGAKLQLVQSPSFRNAAGGPNVFGATAPAGFGSPGSRRPGTGFGARGFLSTGVAQHVGATPGKNAGAGNRRAKSASALMEVAEVRALTGDAPQKGETDIKRSDHEALLARLKSRAARTEAENARGFLAAYRADISMNPASEARLDQLLKTAAQHAEDLKQRSEDLQLEAAEAERRLERMNTLVVVRAADSELQGMTAFERSQRKVQEDKKEEDLQRQKDEVQAGYMKAHRRLQSELIELRDYKVLLREFRKARLEKLEDTLGRTEDGRQLRGTVKEMIRHGAQRILQKLEAAELPLEAWMREVLVNCCHVEIRIEDAEARLLAVRRKALHPVKGAVQAMLSQSQQERFDKICRKTWESRKVDPGQSDGAVLADSAGGGLGETAASAASTLRPEATLGSEDLLGGASTLQRPATGLTASGAEPRMSVANKDSFQLTRQNTATPPEKVIETMKAVENDVSALRRLLGDMRHNAAAVICNQIRQAEKALGRDAGREANEWGRHMLRLLVSEDFAKQIMKELQKSEPHAKLTA